VSLQCANLCDTVAWAGRGPDTRPDVGHDGAGANYDAEACAFETTKRSSTCACLILRTLPPFPVLQMLVRVQHAGQMVHGGAEATDHQQGSQQMT
jgi:hypothetical protein